MLAVWKFLRSLTPRGVAWLLGAVLAAVLAGLLVWNSWQSRAVAKTEARLSQGQTGAALESGRDAVATLGKTSGFEAATDTITEENQRAIRNAPGADAPVDPASRDTGLRSVCRRAAYRGRPECLQFAPAR